MKMQTKSIAVIGAGPAGMTAAYQLVKAGFSVDVYEASDTVGGMSKTIELWGQKVDLGPHRFFSNDRRVNELWLELIGNDYQMVNRLTRIYYKKRFFHYPLKALNALFNLGLLESVHCLLSYIKEKLAPTKGDGTFESWVVQRFGRKLFNTFFKSYSEKLWGLSCKALDKDFAAQRIKNFSLSEAIKSMLKPSGTKHKTLVDQFAYPNEGTGIVYERMASYVMANGGKIFYDTPVHGIDVEGHKVVSLWLEGGTHKNYDDVISTMPLTKLVSNIKNLPSAVKENIKQLRFRNTVLVFLEIDTGNLFPDNWLYIHSEDIHVGRITNFRNWVPELYGEQKTSILVLEYWCNFTDELWTQDDEQIIRQATSELTQTGLNQSAKVLNGFVHRVPNSYPVYETGYKDRLKPVADYLKTIDNLQVIGRYGSFKYNNQDHSILMGLLAAENISEDISHDLWEINTDYDTYQEETTITESGLVSNG